MGQIAPIDIVGPCSKGLNTERKNQLLSPEWATVALNAVVNRSGRLACRKGWATQTTTPISGNHTIDVIFEYMQEDGTKVVLSTANNKIYKNYSDYTDAANDITSSTAPTADHWQFVNFNDKVLGFQRGHTPITWQNSGDFVNAVYTGTGPDGNCACAAYGRVWAADADLQTVRYSALLDETDYSSGAGGGTIDMSSIWTDGMDEITAIAAFGGMLVVFGKNHIVMWADGAGSSVGLNPANLEVVDTVEGTGCIARDSVCATGEGDLIFLSRHGIQSLGRVITQKSNPIVSLSKNVRSDVLETIAQQRASDAQMDQVRAVYSPEEGLYIINFPVVGKMYCLYMNGPFQDDEGDIVVPVTEWQMGGSIVGMCVLRNGNLLFGSSGEIGKYSGNDDDGVAYDFEAKTGWIDFGELNHRLKIMKDFIALVAIGNAASIVWNWEFDFTGDTHTRTVAYTAGAQAEFNLGEFNIAEFSGGVSVARKQIPAYGEGQFIRLGVSASVNGFDLVLQQISISPKIGRMVS